MSPRPPCNILRNCLKDTLFYVCNVPLPIPLKDFVNQMNTNLSKMTLSLSYMLKLHV